jgi:hypothetical protein
MKVYARLALSRYNLDERARHMKLRLVTAFFLLLATSVCAAAQSREIYLGPEPKGMTVQDVIKLSKAGLSDDVIIEQLKTRNQRFDLSTDQLIQLKTAKVSERVIAVMINPGYKPAPGAAVAGKTDSPQPVSSAKEPAPVHTTLAANASTPVESQANANNPLPTQLGVYVKIKGSWTALAPEEVTWKSGSMVKSVASGGIVKGDVNGYVDGGVSNYRVTTPLELLIVVPEGFDIADYQLLKLREHEDFRDFRSVSGGVFHSSGGATRDVVPFDSVKVAPRTFHVTISTALGEYGVLPPGAFTSMNAAASGKIYAFQLVE